MYTVLKPNEKLMEYSKTKMVLVVLPKQSVKQVFGRNSAGGNLAANGRVHH
jgi:hypothetical protein